MSTTAPPKTKFTDALEAKKAMHAVILKMQEHQEELLTASNAAGNEQQKKVAALMPLVQKIVAPVISEFGFMPGPMGIMSGMAAFKAAAEPTDAPQPGFGVGEIKEAIQVLTSAMMSGQAPEKATLENLIEKLK